MIAYLIGDIAVRGGTHKQFLKLLEYTEAQGKDFFVLTFVYSPEKTYPGFARFAERIHIIPLPTATNLWQKVKAKLQLIRDLRAAVADATIINIHDLGFEQLLPAFAGKPVVWQINDLPYCFKVGVSKTRTTWKDKLLCWWIRHTANLYVNAISVNVTKNAERVNSCFGRKAHVFYCGIEPIGLARDTMATEIRRQKRAINLLSSGVFMPYRNYETQVKVIEELVVQGIDARLNIIGSTALSPDYTEEVRALIAQKHLGERITICGMVDEADFVRLHTEADAFMFINIDQSWGLAVFEAMSCGMPVLVSQSVGATEILTDGKDAIFVPPTEVTTISAVIKRLIDDPSYYHNIAHTAQNFHHGYTWQHAYCEPMLNLILAHEVQG
ncbi:MAG: glycosyltransferase [Bacteroidales bacterium]|nr:glycosyltransferase [Bacteroidales bacterium]